MSPGLGGDFSSRPAAHAHRVKVAFRRVGFAGGEVEFRTILGEFDAGNLELARGQLPEIAAERGDFIEMIPAVAFALEIDFVAILEPAERFIAWPIQPSVI